MRHLVFASAATLLVALPANAQTAASGWTGPYVGAQVGYETVDSDRAIVEFDTNRDGAFGDTVRTGAGANAFSTGFCSGRALGSRQVDGCDSVSDEFTGGVHAGFDFDVGGFVLGIVGEYNGHKLEDDVTAFSTTPASYTLTRRLRNSFGVRARAGVPVGGNTLIYATAGAVNGRFRQEFATTNTANAFAVTDRKTSAWGYQAGGGLEYRIARNFSIGGLYLFTTIKDDDESFIDVTRGTAPATNPFVLVNPGGTLFRRTDERFRAHSGKLTASFRF